MESERGGRTTLLVGLGAVLVIGGLVALAFSMGLVPVWLFTRISQVRGPLFLIFAGAALIIVARRHASGEDLVAADAPARSGGRLYRSRDDKWVAGVLGGLGRYLGFDANALRLATVAAMVLGLEWVFLAYLIMAFVIPLEPEVVAAPGPAAAAAPDAQEDSPTAPAAPAGPEV
jgi:phage shock protein PspC (stress-responsive transcriptional regulator)